MKHYSVKFVKKRIKSIPKKVAGVWLLLVLFLVYCIVLLCKPMYQELENLQECEIEIDRIDLQDSHARHGSRMKIEIISNGNTYYVRYPEWEYSKFAHNVEQDLLTGNVKSVRVKIISVQTVRDCLLDRQRIVDVRSGSTVYYDINTEIDNIQDNRVSLWVFFACLVIVMLCSTILILFVYRVLVFKKTTSK